MAYRILSAAIVACLAGLAAAPASAGSTYETRCSRDKWETGVYRCRAEYDSPYSNTTTRCTSGRGGTNCDTETTLKPQPKRRVEPSPYDGGARLMDGHGPPTGAGYGPPGSSYGSAR